MGSQLTGRFKFVIITSGYGVLVVKPENYSRGVGLREALIKGTGTYLFKPHEIASLPPELGRTHDEYGLNTWQVIMWSCDEPPDSLA